MGQITFSIIIKYLLANDGRPLNIYRPAVSQAVSVFLFFFYFVAMATLTYSDLSVFRSSHKDVLATIAKDGKITDETDAKLKKIVTDFIASFSG